MALALSAWRGLWPVAALVTAAAGAVVVACGNETSSTPAQTTPARTTPAQTTPLPPPAAPLPPPTTPLAPPAPPAPAPATVVAPPRTAFETRALAIAGEYASWGRVDDELRWAPGLCRIPLPGVAYMSASNDAQTHGQKLYSVFVRNRAAYPDGPDAEQVVVKESWTAEPVTDPSVHYDPEKAGINERSPDHFYPYARKGDELFRAGTRAGLYIMFKVDPTTPETDGGWVYATITAAGQVTAAGRVASCMGCHDVAPHGRLFGVAMVPPHH